MACKKERPAFYDFFRAKGNPENLKCVDEVICFEDDDLGSCINALRKIKNAYPKEKILFCNGGDRNKLNIPEMSIDGVEFIFGVGAKIKKEFQQLDP